MVKVFDDEKNEEVEVFTQEEMNAKIAERETALRGEYDGKIAEKDKALSERAGEFKQFRRLTDETVAKLSEAEKTIYNNGLILEEERQKRAGLESDIYKGNVEKSLRSRVGTNDKLFEEAKKMWDVIGLEARTPEEIENKTLAVLGAIGATNPDLVSTIGGFSGGFAPPAEKKSGNDFADKPEGKALAESLGLKLEVDKK